MKLVRRREVWLPTLWGWFFLALAGALAALAGICALYPYLAVNAPLGGPILVVEGWLSPPELDEAVAAFRRGGYQMVVTTGGPLHSWPEPAVDSTFAHRAADYLRKHGLGDVRVVPAPSPITEQDRTYHSALMVREWAQKSGLSLSRLDVLSRGPHARRSRFLYRLAFNANKAGPQVEIGVVAVAPYDYDPARWWRRSNGARDVLEQTVGLAWVACFFRPLSP